MTRIAPLRVTACTLVSAAGSGLAASLEALGARRSGLRPNDFGGVPLETWLGRVAGIESTTLPERIRGWDSRNNRLAWLGLEADRFHDAVEAARDR